MTTYTVHTNDALIRNGSTQIGWAMTYRQATSKYGSEKFATRADSSNLSVFWPMTKSGDRKTFVILEGNANDRASALFALCEEAVAGATA